MRSAMTAGLIAVLAAGAVTRAEGGEDAPGNMKASDAAITAAAERLVIRHHPAGTSQKPRLSFDKPEIMPQPERGKYAVFGGYMAFSGGGQPEPHAYGMAMRLTCPRQQDSECWQLEKLLIDQALVVDR